MGIRAVANYTGKRSCHRMPGSTKSLTERVADLITSFNGPKVWYDPSDISTLQQDAAGTVPVTTAGDPIGRIMDKSGAANHATQVTAGSRPIWQTTFAALDGTDDSWLTPSIDFTSTDKVTVITGIRKISDASVGMVVELSPSLSPGAFYISAPNSPASASITFSQRGASATVLVSSTALAAPTTQVVSGIGNLSGPLTTIRTNGQLKMSSTTSLGGGTYGNYPLYIGRRNNATLPFNGNLYGLIIIGRLLTASEVVLCEQYMAQKASISF